MIETIAVCALWGVVCVVASKIYVEHKKKEIERKAVTGAVEAYSEGLKRFADGSAEKCPMCAHSNGGILCEKADMANLVRFGTCTNFEEKRY